MTLRKKESDNQPEFDPAEVIKMEKFTQWIKELTVYLGQFRRYNNKTVPCYFEKDIITTAKGYDNHFMDDLVPHESYLCVAGGRGKSKNKYVHLIVETIFPNLGYSGKNAIQNKLPYNCKSEEFGYDAKQIESVLIHPASLSFHRIWRDDINFPGTYSKRLFHHVLTFKEYRENRETRYCKEYQIFWNLFLLAIDDDIYNKQLSNVIELAHYFDFDEPMMRDWCRAVEYVLAGNKLSEDCDLECETVEGARFFLHKKE